MLHSFFILWERQGQKERTNSRESKEFRLITHKYKATMFYLFMLSRYFTSSLNLTVTPTSKESRHDLIDEVADQMHMILTLFS